MSLSNQFVSLRRRVGLISSLIAVLSLTLPSTSLLTRWAVRTVLADTTPQTLPFAQNWTTTTLITVDDTWTGVPGIIGYRGDDAAAGTAVDPQTVTQDLSAVTDVNANRSDPNVFATGGVTEFDGIANPVVALQGSGTADFPNLVISLDTTGQNNIQVSYNLRDIDGGVDNSVQAVALQYRVGASGAYTNIPAGFVADASTGPSLATLVTPVNVTLPAACNNQPVVQVRVITSNAIGNDEWIGVDDISISAPTAADSVVSGSIRSNEGEPLAGAVVNLSGTQNRKTITDANGNYRFEAVETNGFYTVRPTLANFAFAPAERSFSQLGNQTEAAFVGSPTGDDANLLDTPEYFVRQHYLDFLGREPDEIGFNFWSDQILECGHDAACSERRTVNVSAAYFLSIEFQQTGGLVDRLYKASYARNPLYAEFMPDNAAMARDLVVGRSGWEQQLATNKESFVNSWVERAAFRAAYDGFSNDAYVDALVSNTGASYAQSERAALLSGLNAGTLSRANVLERIANSENFAKARFNEAFVMMEYFGYLRRDPDASGYQFWLNKLNQFDGNFERAEMVKAFIVSGEYRARFDR